MGPRKYNLRPKEWVTEVTTLSSATIYREIKAGRFPPPVIASPGRVAWLEADVIAWINIRRSSAAVSTDENA